MKKGTFMYVWNIFEGYDIRIMYTSIIVYKTMNVIYIIIMYNKQYKV